MYEYTDIYTLGSLYLVHQSYIFNISRSKSLASDSPGQLNILRHDGYPMSVDSTEISIFKQTHHVGLSCFLQCENGLRLEPEVGFVFLGNLSHESLERQFSDEQLSTLLELPNFSESHRSWSKSMHLLGAASSRQFCSVRLGDGVTRRLPRSLVGQLFSWCFCSGVLPSSLLSSCHRTDFLFIFKLIIYQSSTALINSKIKSV